MAKKRRRKKKSANLKAQVKYELIGLLFIFIAIFGSGASAISDGAVPAGLENILRFIFGIWYFIASVVFFATGIYFMIKRQIPNMLHKRLVGFYIIFAGLLLYTHIVSFENILANAAQPSIIKTTWSHFIEFVNGNIDPSQLGGGIIGALLFAFSYYLFSATGAKFVSIFTILIGIMFLTEFSIGQFLEKVWNQIKKLSKQVRESWVEMLEKRREKKEEAAIAFVDQQEKQPKQTETTEETPVIQEFPDIAYSTENNEQESNTLKQQQTTKEESESEEDPRSESLPMPEAEH